MLLRAALLTFAEYTGSNELRTVEVAQPHGFLRMKHTIINSKHNQDVKIVKRSGSV
jgi:hypothetical protein